MEMGGFCHAVAEIRGVVNSWWGNINSFKLC